MKLNQFETLEDARTYTTQIVNDTADIRSYLTLKNKWREIVGIMRNLEHPLFDAAEGIYQFAKEGKPISFHSDSVTGQVHLSLLDAFMTAGFIDANDKVAILSLCHKPYRNATQEMFNQAKYTPVNQEVNYPDGLSYIETSKSQGVDVFLTNITVDGSFELFLDTCMNGTDKDVSENYIPFSGGAVVARLVSKNGFAQFNLSNNKLRQYNRLYVRSLHDCTFDTQAFTNRG